MFNKYIFSLVKKIVATIGLFYLIQIKPLDGLDWSQNGRLFLSGLTSGNLSNTYIGPDLFHPGISIVWISAAIWSLFSWLNHSQIVIVHQAVFIGIFTTLIFITYKLWLKILPAKLFWLTLIYMICHPFSVSIGTTTWLDTLLVCLGFPIVLYWVDFLKYRHLRSLLLCSLFIGAAILTKYIAVDYILIIFLISLFSNSRYEYSFHYDIKPLLKVLLISLTTFVLFYPAIWIIPNTVLFERFDTPRSYQSLSFQHIGSSLGSYTKHLWKVDYMLWIGILIAGYYLIYKKNTIYSALAISGLTHFFVLVIIILLLYDHRRGVDVFISNIGRYQLSTLLFMIPLYFQFIFQLKAARIIKYSLIGIPFILLFYQIDKFSFFPSFY